MNPYQETEERIKKRLAEEIHAQGLTLELLEESLHWERGTLQKVLGEGELLFEDIIALCFALSTSPGEFFASVFEPEESREEANWWAKFFKK